MEDHAADHLYVEVAHADDAAAGFADDGEGFGKEIVEDGLFGGSDLFGIGEIAEGLGDAGAELEGLGGEFGVGEGLEGVFVAVDLGEDGEKAFDGALVGGTEDFSKDIVEQGDFLFAGATVNPRGANEDRFS